MASGFGFQGRVQVQPQTIEAEAQNLGTLERLT